MACLVCCKCEENVQVKNGEEMGEKGRKLKFLQVSFSVFDSNVTV